MARGRKFNFLKVTFEWRIGLSGWETRQATQDKGQKKNEWLERSDFNFKTLSFLQNSKTRWIFQTVATSAAGVLSRFSLTLCDSMNHSPPGSSIHVILQARILDWVVTPSSRRSSQSRDGAPVSYVSCIDRGVSLLPALPGKPNKLPT